MELSITEVLTWLACPLCQSECPLISREENPFVHKGSLHRHDFEDGPGDLRKVET